jgi:hypothetical protein
MTLKFLEILGQLFVDLDLGLFEISSALDPVLWG